MTNTDEYATVTHYVVEVSDHTLIGRHIYTGTDRDNAREVFKRAKEDYQDARLYLKTTRLLEEFKRDNA